MHHPGDPIIDRPINDVRLDTVEPLRLAFRGTPGVDTLALTGSLDLHTTHLLRDMVWGALCTQPLLALDLSGLQFLDARGIAGLIAMRRRTVARGAELVLVCSDPHIRKVLRTCRLDSVLQVVDDMDEVHVLIALAALGS